MGTGVSSAGRWTKLAKLRVGYRNLANALKNENNNVLDQTRTRQSSLHATVLYADGYYVCIGFLFKARLHYALP
jgi:hypothetical protein